MKKTFMLDGLDCAHCAAKIEEAVRSLDGVSEVSVSFLTQKMTLEADDARFEDILCKAEALIKTIDDEVELYK